MARPIAWLASRRATWHTSRVLRLRQGRGARCPQRLPRLLPWVLVAIGPPLLGRCGGAVEHGTEAEAGSGSPSVPSSAQTSGNTVDAGEGGPSDACTTLRQTLAARVSAGFANLDTTCLRDEDCLFVSPSVGCYSSCPSLISSRSVTQTAPDAVLQDIAPLCEEFEEEHCEASPLVCNAGRPTLFCDGTCARVDSASCDDLLRVASVRVTSIFDDAPRACSSDDDCALAQATLVCVPSCGNLQSVASSALEGLQRSIAAAQGLYCGSLKSRGCPAQPQLPCVAPRGTTRAACNAGQCQVTYAPLP